MMVDRARYVRVVRFFAGAFASIVWWDIILRSLPGLGDMAAASSLERWRSIAHRFRQMAVQLGGVLIKLGQFLSIRVDMLPAEVISELTGLQDEVPAEDLADIQMVIAEEFGRPVGEIFSWFAPHPEAAASLAQVHRARLAHIDGTDADVPGGTGNGREVVVKVQRPRMQRIVETDLAAIRLATRWLKLYPPITRRVDVDRFFTEFAATTRAELDFAAEGKNADRFATDFADDPGVVIPKVYWDYTSSRVLTMENVAAIKITDHDAITAAGINCAEVASRLYRAYLRQIFVTNFVHADPHPGNLFVRECRSPLAEKTPSQGSQESGVGSRDDYTGVRSQPPGDTPPVSRGGAGEGGLSQGIAAGDYRNSDGRPFQIIFVDFGMVAVVPERLRSHARDFLIGLATRDSHRVVQAYIGSGLLLPGADRKRLEEVHDALFQRLYGMKLGHLRQLAMEEALFLWREYRDIIYEMPFQFPADVLFVVRALGILSGIATSLNPDFEPWAETMPFAKRLAGEQLGRDWRGWLDEMSQLLRLLWQLPYRLDRVITQVERGQLTMVASLAPDATRILHRVERSVDRLTWGVIFMSLLISGVILRMSEGPSWASTAMLAGAGFALLWSLTRR